MDGAKSGWDALPPAARLSVARLLTAGNVQFAVRPVAGGALVARGAGALTARFTAGGVDVSVSGGGLRLGLTAMGRGPTPAPVAPVVPAGHGNVVSYRHGSVREWYANGQLGLEQGFAIAARPAGTGALTLVAGRIGTSSTVRLDRAGSALVVGPVRYDQLRATDARGRELPARIVVTRDRIELRIDDSEARYPLAVDPVASAAVLTASDVTGSDALGSSVAISADGRTIAAGSPRHSVAGQSNRGAVYVFSEPAGGWADATQTAELTADDGAGGDELGFAVAMSADGRTIAGASGKGAYVFAEPAAGWADATQTAELSLPAPSNGYVSPAALLALSGDGTTIVLPGGGNILSGPDAGLFGELAVYVRPAGGWADSATPTAILTDSAKQLFLTASVAISADGGTVAAGTEYSLSGSTEVFARAAGGWADQSDPVATLTPSDGTDFFGSSVSLSADGRTLAAGATNTCGVCGSHPGRAYVFVEPPSGWTSGHETAELSPADGYDGDTFGNFLAIGRSGHRLLVSGDSWNAVYVYDEPSTGWATTGDPSAKLTVASAVSLSYSLAIGGQTIAAGDPSGSPGFYGSGRVFALANPTQSTSLSSQVIDEGSGAAWSGSETVGAQASDSASLTGPPSSLPATGTVTYGFYDGATCSGTPTTQTVTLNADGTVPDSAATNGLAAGDYSYRASYSGDDSYAPSTSDCEPFTVGKATVHVDANPASKAYGEADPPTTGTLRASDFVNGDTPASAGVTGAAGCSIAGHAEGVAVYAGVVSCGPGTLEAANYRFVSGDPADLTIGLRSSGVLVDCSPSSVVVGQPSTCTATVSDTDAGRR